MISVAEIEQRLRARVEEVGRWLLPGARKEGAYLKCGSVAGEAGQSLVLNLSGTRAGLWNDYAADTHGDMIDLISATMGLVAKRDAVAVAKDWLGIADSWSPRDAVRPSPQEMERQAEAARQRAEERRAAEAAEDVLKIKRARALYLSGVPIEGTPADAYLRGRGLLPYGVGGGAGAGVSGAPEALSRRQADAPEALSRQRAGAGEWPRSLRYQPETWCRAVSDKIPAMLAAIYLADGSHVGTHRTYLQKNKGAWTKLQDASAKMILGKSWGGFVPISKGASGKPMAGIAEGEPVYMAEGIEDCIAARMIIPHARIIAGISVGNMGAIILPPAAKRLVILADRDEKTAAIDALGKTLARQQARGLQVDMVMPPRGCKDLNDWLRAALTEQHAKRGAAA